MPGPKTDAPYAPQTLLPGGVVIPLYPPGSPYLRAQDIREPEVYRMWAPGQVGAITHIHNPSIEFHPGNGQLATGAASAIQALPRSSPLTLRAADHQPQNPDREVAYLVAWFAFSVRKFNMPMLSSR